MSLDRSESRGSFSAFDCPVVAEAGAGTGKTTVLVARVVAWCVGPGWRHARERLVGDDREDQSKIAARVVDGVVAITFTEAAAAEMAERVGHTLRDLACGNRANGLDVYGVDAEDQNTRVRAKVLLSVLDRLALTTIHAFCRNLLVRFPFEARLDPAFIVDADGRILEETVQEVVDEALRLESGAELRRKIFAAVGLGLDPPMLAEALMALGSMPLDPADLSGDVFDAGRVRALANRVGQGFGRLRTLLADRLDGGGRTKNASALLLGAQAIESYLELAGERVELSGLLEKIEEYFPKNLRTHLGKWAKGQFSQSEGLLLDELAHSLAEICAQLYATLVHMTRLNPDFLEKTLPVFAEMVADVHERMRRRGAHTFSWLLRDAHALLLKNPDTLNAIRRGIDQLFVDEFQDTDPIQCGLVRMLALQGPVKERPGLFLVGDPKQSIYGWRSADIRAYAEFVREVLDAGGISHSLTTNYRSGVAILDEVERVMEPVMIPCEGVQPPFLPLSPSPDAIKGEGFDISPRVAVEHWVSWAWDAEEEEPDVKLSAPRCAALEAKAIAEDLLSLRRDAVVSLWSEIGILFRSTGDLEVYLSALRGAGIPYVVERDRNYYRRREVIEAAALIRALVDPCDDLALLTFFRSALVGVPDAALLPMWRRGIPGLISKLDGENKEVLDLVFSQLDQAIDEIPEGIPGIERIDGWVLNFRVAIRSLNELRRSFLVESADLFIDRVRGFFLPELTEGARYLGAYRVANIERFFRECSDALEESGSDIDALLDALRRNIRESREAEEAKPGDAAKDAVQIMTIHKSKGLAFEHVYCVQLHKESAAGRRGNAKPVDVEWAHGTGTLEFSFFGALSLGFDLVERQRAEVEEAERVRTLYVAMTRARKRLVMLGRWKIERSEEIRSHMDLLSARSETPEDLRSLMADSVENGGSYLDEHGVRWFFPALSENGDSVASDDWHSSSPMAEAPLSKVKVIASALAKSREAARVRMERSFSGTASGEKGEERHLESFEWNFELSPLASDFEKPAAGSAYPSALYADIGTSVHRFLEYYDFRQDSESELAQNLDELRAWIGGTFPAQVVEPVWEGSCAIIRALVVGPIWERLCALGDSIVGRELPMIMPPDKALSSALGFISGTLDMVYRDPHSGEFVIVDYKTDRASSLEDLQEHAQAYSGQGRIYTEAMKRALDLDYEPAFELWFLRYGAILRAQISKTPRKSRENPRV